MTLPNLISLLRLAAVPLLAWLIASGRYAAAFWLFVATGASDALDGYLARALKQRTRLGAYLDPLADKALMAAVFVTLGIVGKLDWWLVILVVSRDVVIVGGVIVMALLDRRMAAEPSFIGKANTAVQIAFIALVLARFGLDLGGWIAAVEWAKYAVAATALISGAHYVFIGLRRLAETAAAAKPGARP